MSALPGNDMRVLAFREGAEALRGNARKCRAIVSVDTNEPPLDLQQRAAELDVLAGLLIALAEEIEAAS